jgi:hypothetical protein
MTNKRQQFVLELLKSGRYSATVDGAVFSHASTHSKPRKHPHKLTPVTTALGYQDVHLCANNKAMKIRVHQVVWLAHQGEIPKLLQINHKNGVKTDNRLDNLELLSASENTKHAIKTGLKKILRGKEHPSFGKIFPNHRMKSAKAKAAAANWMRKNSPMRGRLGQQHPTIRPVVCTTNGVFYWGINEASRKLNMKAKLIWKSAKYGGTTNGFKFRYATDLEIANQKDLGSNNAA